MIVSRERSASMVECLARDQGAAGSSLTRGIALCPLARQINPSFVLVQPRKTIPYIAERLLMGHKESNQTSKWQTTFILIEHIVRQSITGEMYSLQQRTILVHLIW